MIWEKITPASKLNKLSVVKEKLKPNQIKYQKFIICQSSNFYSLIRFSICDSLFLDKSSNQLLIKCFLIFGFLISSEIEFFELCYGNIFCSQTILSSRFITNGARTDTKGFQRIRIPQLSPFLLQTVFPQIFLSVLGIYNYQHQTKQNMAYHFPFSWHYPQFPLMNHFLTNHAYPTYQAFQTFGTFLPIQFSTNDQIKKTQIDFDVQVKNAETRDCPNNKPEEIQQQELKKNQEIKLKKKTINVHKELESAKKNCESNLVNQFLSYFSSVTNSSALIHRTLQKMNLEKSLKQKKRLEQTFVFFCKQVSIVNSRKERKYVNKAFLQNFFDEAKLEKCMPDILQNVQNSDLIRKEDFCELFRRCCFHFFRTVSVSSVTSSAKLNIISRPEHIKRRRLIVESLSKNLQYWDQIRERKGQKKWYKRGKDACKQVQEFKGAKGIIN